MTAVPSDYDSDPERFLADSKWPHDNVHSCVAASLAAVQTDGASSPVSDGCFDAAPTMRGCVVCASKGRP